MKRIGLIILCGIVLSSFSVKKKYTAEDYIEMYADDAVKEMKRSGVPASITLAQGMLESGYGNSELARKANNHFGIKCHSDWTGPVFKMDDDTKNECFRKYKTVWHSYRDHSDFLSGKKRYAFLFDLKMTDYKGWCKGLKKAGYATNPKYAKLLIDLIEKHDLNRFVIEAGRKHKRKVDQKEDEEPIYIEPEDTTHLRADEEGGDEFEVDYDPAAQVMLSDNFVKYVIAESGDTYESIAKDQKISLNLLLKYNDAVKGDVLNVGDRVYLQPKRSKSKTKTHTMSSDETLRSISQMYAIKVKAIYKRNGWSEGYTPEPGVVILLRGKKR